MNDQNKRINKVLTYENNFYDELLVLLNGDKELARKITSLHNRKMIDYMIYKLENLIDIIKVIKGR